MKRKNIGIFGWKLGENSFGVTTAYYNFINQYGDPQIITPILNPDLSQYDLLIVPGGPDLAPNTYGAVPSMSTGKSDPIRDYFDKYVIPIAANQKIPIFGICRGHQSIAVMFGATMIQNMYHETNIESKRYDTVHKVVINNEPLPFKFNNGVKTPILHEVNSLHHQVVYLSEETKESWDKSNIHVVATHHSSKEHKDSYIEAICYNDHNIITVQWHPEEIWDDFTDAAMNYLLSLSDKPEE